MTSVTFAPLGPRAPSRAGMAAAGHRRAPGYLHPAGKEPRTPGPRTGGGGGGCVCVCVWLYVFVSVCVCVYVCEYVCVSAVSYTRLTLPTMAVV